ncbi:MULTISPECIES: DUF4870 family protein [Acinetobacter]|uniref:DUF4870 family protein n=1 Tax=Acinetobacter TaxID=469 RepID=UPI001363157E|nr:MULTISPECIES: hypothetical protein [Acinetobacter]MDM1272418.1 hypothetical protein [Acinetobacter indicus]UNW09395.1 hypothetical protein MOW14_13040 [Acinetobacter indicus]
MNTSIDRDPNRSLTFILYLLYIVAIFSAGLLAIVALIINYVKRGAVRGSIFESHFTWQIRSFWWYLFWNIVAFVPFFFIFFIDEDPTRFAQVVFGASAFCLAVIGLSWLWIVYRAIRGIMRLNDNEPMYS